MAKKEKTTELVNKPISSWGYVGLSFLYATSVVGIIFLFIHAFKSKNINLRNFARSYFIQYIIAFVMSVVMIVLLLVFGTPGDFEFGQDGSYEVFGRMFNFFNV